MIINDDGSETACVFSRRERQPDEKNIVTLKGIKKLIIYY